MILSDTETCYFVVRRYYSDRVPAPPVDLKTFPFNPDAAGPEVQRVAAKVAAVEYLNKERADYAGCDFRLLEVNHRERREA